MEVLKFIAGLVFLVVVLSTSFYVDDYWKSKELELRVRTNHMFLG